MVDARRLSEAREPLVVHIHIVMGEAGQPRLSGWRRVSWAEVERRCGGRIIVEPLVRPFLPRRVEEPAPLVPAAAPANARSERVVTTDDAAHQPVPRLRDVLQGLAAKRAGEALA